jgi:hypothetical protein
MRIRRLQRERLLSGQRIHQKQKEGEEEEEEEERRR